MVLDFFSSIYPLAPYSNTFFRGKQ